MKKYFKISFFSIILIMLITFIPNVSAETTKYKCIHYIEKDGKRVTLLESTWKKLATGKYTFDGATPIENDYYKVKASNSSDYEPNGTCLNIAPYLDKDDSSLYFSFLTGINKNPLEGVKVEQVFINDTEMTGCSSYDNSQETCNKQSNCEWRWVNESAGDGYCWTKDTNTGGKDDDPKKDNGYAEEIKNFFLGKTTCGGITSFTFPDILPKITSSLYNLLKVAVPVILIIKGMLDMFKAATSQKEDEMKKAQKKFVQRLIAGILALLVFIIVETIISFIAKGTGNDNAWGCVDCFINNKCKKAS